MESEAAVVYRAIRVRLTTPPADDEIWSDRVYAELAPNGAARPYLVTVVNGYERLPETARRAALLARITCAADTFADAHTAVGRIAELLDGALDGGTDWAILSVTQVGSIQKTHLVDGVPVYEAGAIFRFVLEAKTAESHGARLTRVIHFGGVTLPDTGLAFRDNFARFDPLETVLPGLDGALDQGGAGAAGRIEYRLRLAADSAAAMVTARDAIKGLARIGAAELVIEPSPGGAQRSTWARLIDAAIEEGYAAETHVRSEAVLTFAAPTPRWFSTAQPTGSGTAQACGGVLTEFTRTANGNAAAYPVIAVTAGSALTSVKIQRIVSGAAVDEVAYMGAIGAGGLLVIDARALQVTRNGVDAYNAYFSALDPAWFRLMPGANTIRVILGAGESAAVSVTWKDCWY